MKLSNLATQSYRSFASVFLAFSLFGFVFAHQTHPTGEHHPVNQKMSLQTSKPETNTTDPGYEWFY